MKWDAFFEVRTKFVIIIWTVTFAFKDFNGQLTNIPTERKLTSYYISLGAMKMLNLNQLIKYKINH